MLIGATIPFSDTDPRNVEDELPDMYLMATRKPIQGLAKDPASSSWLD
jgi:hypothetical protein